MSNAWEREESAKSLPYKKKRPKTARNLNKTMATHEFAPVVIEAMEDEEFDKERTNFNTESYECKAEIQTFKTKNCETGVGLEK